MKRTTKLTLLSGLMLMTAVQQPANALSWRQWGYITAGVTAVVTVCAVYTNYVNPPLQLTINRKIDQVEKYETINSGSSSSKGSPLGTPAKSPRIKPDINSQANQSEPYEVIELNNSPQSSPVKKDRKTDPVLDCGNTATFFKDLRYYIESFNENPNSTYYPKKIENCIHDLKDAKILHKVLKYEDMQGNTILKLAQEKFGVISLLDPSSSRAQTLALINREYKQLGL